MRDRSPAAKGLFLLLHLEAGCDRNSAPAHKIVLWGFSGWEERGHRHHSLDKLQKQLDPWLPRKSLAPSSGRTRKACPSSRSSSQGPPGSQG